MESRKDQKILLIFIFVLSFLYLIRSLIKCCLNDRNRVRNAREPPELPQNRRLNEEPNIIPRDLGTLI